MSASNDSEEKERQEEFKKAESYREAYNSKLFLKVYKRNENAFEVKFPKSSYDKIIQLYGPEEKIAPLSFVLFANPFEVQTIRYSSHNVNVRTSVQINSILSLLNNYYVYPKSYEQLDEMEKLKLAPKLKSKYINDIAIKMGISFSEMINYISLQMTEIDFRETMKTVVSYKIYQLVFNLIHLLKAKFPNGNNLEIAFYSFRKLAKMIGIEHEKCIPYLEMFTLENTTRDAINKERHILYEKVHTRELKESINDKIKDQHIDLYAGINSCDRIPKPDPLILEPFREEASNLLLSIIEEKERKEREERERIERERLEKERQEREEKERLEREEKERQEQEEKERLEKEEKERQEREEKERLEREEKERQEQEEKERLEREEKERQEREEKERLEREEKERQEQEEKERLEREEKERQEREEKERLEREEKERQEQEEKERLEREEKERQEREEKERLEREEKERQEQEEKERLEREEKERQEREEKERLEREEKERQEQEEKERLGREEKERQEREERERLEREEKERQEREERERLEREERERQEKEKEPEPVVIEMNDKPENDENMAIKSEVKVLRGKRKGSKTNQNKSNNDFSIRRRAETILKKKQFKIRRAVFVKVEK